MSDLIVVVGGGGCAIHAEHCGVTSRYIDRVGLTEFDLGEHSSADFVHLSRFV